jgi:4,5-DOPA dioxygenase extradiol
MSSAPSLFYPTEGRRYSPSPRRPADTVATVTVASDVPMPAAFFGHGSPMNAIENNRYTEAWAGFGATTPPPRAVVAISAHWYIQATAVTAMATPRTIHDFFGFPDDLFAFAYAAPGAPDVADEIVETLRPRWVGLDHDSWGFDHGTWSVLAHVLPAADVPVVQLAINALQPLEYHFELGTRLAPLRDRNVLIVGSGNVVHNLAAIDPQQRNRGFDWAVRFNDAVATALREAPEDIVALGEHRDFHLAAPSPDHFLPLVYLAGLAAAAGRAPDIIVDGYAYGSLSMTSYALTG